MMTIKRFFLTLTLAATMALPLYAYNETVNHRQMTIVATEKSALYTDGSIMSALGLNPAQSQLFIYNGRLGNVPMGTDLFTLSAFVAEGAIEEDEGWRARHHFYDPVHNRSINAAIAWRSWEWMLEDRPIEDQDRSLRDARDFLTVAMTFNQGTPAEAHAERTLALTRMLLSLGHVMHHLQDMAQPQHVRHDQHVETWWTGPLGASNPSRFEHYTAERPGVVSEQSERAVPVFPGSSDFRSARDFWFNTAGTGVAQWVNRDFVSQGTNFVTTDANVTAGRFALPKPGTSTDYTVAELYAQSGMAVPVRIQNLCGDPPDICRMRMYSTAVSQRASTLSIFDQDMRAGVLIADEDGFSYIITRLFDLNRFNFDDAHQELIQRAVSYSAGFLNHFFRGKLQITPPMTGPYAVVDHSTNEGFSTITAKVRNMTEGEALPEGMIRVIAKFRRNGCYTPELTGEFKLQDGRLIPPCPDYRSPDIHARVSHSQSLALGVGGAMELTFTFPEPIPLDATDLVLHVYYTGQVGEEAESFALGVADISEPTFIAFLNATDVFGLRGVFYYGQEIIDNIAREPYSAADSNHDGIYATPPDLDVRGQDLFFEITLDGEKVGDTATVPQGRFARIAALVDPVAGTQLDLWVVGRLMISDHISARFFQHYPDGRWRLSIPSPLRNTMQFNSATFFRYDLTIPDIDSMQESKVVNAGILVPVYLTENYLPSTAPSNQWTKSMEVLRGMSANALAPMLPRQRPNSTALPVKPQIVTMMPEDPAAPAAVRAIRPHAKSLPVVESVGPGRSDLD